MKIKTLQILLLIIMMMGSTVAFSENGYFPNKAFFNPQDLDDFTSEWYTGQLRALEELSIYKQSNDNKLSIFRFTWLRTFHHPISIRLEINKDDSGRLISKMTSGAGGYEPGKIMINENRQLTKSEITGFLKLINENNFWKLPTELPNPDADGKFWICMDGARWILEGLYKGNYHIIDRCSPKDGSIKDLCLYLLKLSGPKFKDEKIY